MIQKKAFSLIELMIVIVIIGALVSIILTSFDYSERTAENDSVQVEMYNIRKAFVAYYNDNFPDFDEDGAFHLVARFGVGVLCEQSSSYYDSTLSSTSDKDLYDSAFADKDLKNKLGWNGPYIMQEGRRTVSIDNDFDATTIWQNDSSNDTTSGSTSSVSIPVVQDPFGGYYRIVIPKGDLKDGNGERFLPQYAYIVCTGANLTLQTFSEDFDDDEDSETYLQLVPEKDTTTGYVNGKPYDDEILMIFPEYIN